MAAFLLGFLLLFTMAAHSDGAYCVCNSGVTDPVLQKNIDYACGAGADCSAILQTGSCYNPNTIKDHCNYAVNSYYQRKGQVQGSCDFMGTATVTQTPPTATNGCVYQSSPSTGGSTTPPAAGTPNTGGTTTVPGTGTGTGIGLAPSGNGFSNTDNSSGSVRVLSQSSILILCFLCLLISLSSGF